MALRVTERLAGLARQRSNYARSLLTQPKSSSTFCSLYGINQFAPSIQLRLSASICYRKFLLSAHQPSNPHSQSMDVRIGRIWRSINHGIASLSHARVGVGAEKPVVTLIPHRSGEVIEANKPKISLCAAGASSTTSFGVNKHIKFYRSIFFLERCFWCFHRNLALTLKPCRRREKPIWINERNWSLEIWRRREIHADPVDLHLIYCNHRQSSNAKLPKEVNRYLNFHLEFHPTALAFRSVRRHEWIIHLDTGFSREMSSTLQLSLNFNQMQR